MRYKVVRLQASADEIVDIPQGCIPIEYSIKFIERTDTSVSSTHKLLFGDPSYIETKREVTVLQPIEDFNQLKPTKLLDENDEDVCFFCELEVTKDRIGTKPVCPKCIALIYQKAKESHKSSDC